MNYEHLRRPPSNLEMEMCTLASLFLDQQERIRDEVFSILQPTAFYQRDNQIVFNMIKWMHDNQHPLDAVTLRDQLDNARQLEMVGGVEYIVKLINATPDSSNGLYYARQIRKYAVQREFIQKMTELENRGYNEDIDELIGTCLRDVQALEMRTTPDETTCVGETMPQTITEVVKRRDRIGTPGLTTGFEELDIMTGGMEPGQMIVVAGRPSMGKTAYALNIACHANRSGARVLVFSMEMSRHQINERILSMTGMHSISDLRDGRVLEDKLGTPVGMRDVWVNDDPMVTLGDIRSIIRKRKMSGGCDLVVIDYLQLIHDPDQAGQVLGERVPYLAGVSPKFGVHCQAGAVEHREGGRALIEEVEEGPEAGLHLTPWRLLLLGSLDGPHQPVACFGQKDLEQVVL